MVTGLVEVGKLKGAKRITPSGVGQAFKQLRRTYNARPYLLVDSILMSLQSRVGGGPRTGSRLQSLSVRYAKYITERSYVHTFSPLRNWFAGEDVKFRDELPRGKKIYRLLRRILKHLSWWKMVKRLATK